MFTQDITETLDYSFEWSLDDDDEIAVSAWEISPAGPSIGINTYAPTRDATSTTVWIVGTGATIGVSYRLTNRITTDNTPPRIIEKSVDIRFINK